MSVNTATPCLGTFHKLCLAWFMCVRARVAGDAEASIPKQESGLVYASKVLVSEWYGFIPSSLLHSRCWSWKAVRMSIVGISKVKKNKTKNSHSNKENYIFNGFLLQWCRDTLNCSEHKQMSTNWWRKLFLLLGVCVGGLQTNLVCAPIYCFWTAYVHKQCLGTWQHY